MTDLQKFILGVCNAFDDISVKEWEMLEFLDEFVEDHDSSVITVPFKNKLKLNPIPLEQNESKLRSGRINGKRKNLPSLFKNGEGEKNVGTQKRVHKRTRGVNQKHNI